MKVLFHIVALAAALLMAAPDICLCGCPCGMIGGGAATPSGAAAKPVSSCCHCAAPTAETSLAAPHACGCAAKDAATIEAPTVQPVHVAAVFHVAEVASTLPLLAPATSTCHDPPVASPPSLHAVLRI